MPHGAFLGFTGITGDYLNEAEEADREGGLDRYRNALSPDGYFVSRHLRCEEFSSDWSGIGLPI